MPVNPNDTICKPVSELKAVYTAAQLYVYTDSLLKIADGQIKELKNKFNLCQDKDTATVNGYNRQIAGLKKEIENYLLEKKEYERIQKWDKFKRKLWGGVGATAIGIMAFIIITK